MFDLFMWLVSGLLHPWDWRQHSQSREQRLALCFAQLGMIPGKCDSEMLCLKHIKCLHCGLETQC